MMGGLLSDMMVALPLLSVLVVLAGLVVAGYVLLTTDTLANFNANSLSIGALRNNNANGTTTLDVELSGRSLGEVNAAARALPVPTSTPIKYLEPFMPYSSGNLMQIRSSL